MHTQMQLFWVVSCFFTWVLPYQKYKLLNFHSSYCCELDPYCWSLLTNICSRVLCTEYFSLHGNKTIWEGVGNFCKREPCLQRGKACSCRLWCFNSRKVNGLFEKNFKNSFCFSNVENFIKYQLSKRIFGCGLHH